MNWLLFVFGVNYAIYSIAFIIFVPSEYVLQTIAYVVFTGILATVMYFGGALVAIDEYKKLRK
jgi:hypothetical protein